ncbi:MAG TPA: tRNA-uridine aminocarboxypropyltransferase [Polyangiales bacterium]
MTSAATPVHSDAARAIRSRRLPRCSICGLFHALCLCESLPRCASRVELLVVLHRKERFKSTNTGKLAARLLERAACVVRDGTQPLAAQVPSAGSWVLFPSEQALSLEEAAARGIRRLIVPDGTWQQATRMARRDPACSGLPSVRLGAPRASRYGLRRNARPEGLCTLEAIAEALRVLEGDTLAEALLGVFDTWVERSRQVRAGAHGMQPWK